MGRGAANDAACVIKKLLNEKDDVNIIFAAAPSQNEFLEALMLDNDIEWGRINAFHMDEYIGLPADAPQGFGNFLKERIFDRVPFKSITYLNGNATDIEEECIRYTKLLKDNPVDIVCMGIGENGHIAFNDPHVAFFNDDKWVKVVDLDLKCRNQQVHDGCFANLDAVPTHALTLTIPALLSAEHIFCVVPAITKAEAVKNTVNGPITEQCPASILRNHENAVLYVDKDSGKYIL
ncbi:glucosamine-6-phosphate deaminase [Xylanivirga thermophila]|uniref:glucosamine-6-phosphate deaminase n=1 Tax=Xylanivirga thermophila TaxID=2496273 RepID=UPI00101BFE36